MVTIIDDINKLLELGIGDSEKLKAIRNNYEKDGMISIGERKYVSDLVDESQTDSEPR